MTIETEGRPDTDPLDEKELAETKATAALWVTIAQMLTDARTYGDVRAVDSKIDELFDE